MLVGFEVHVALLLGRRASVRRDSEALKEEEELRKEEEG